MFFLWFCDSVIQGLQNFSKIYFTTFIYQQILIKPYMNANIEKTQILHLIKYDLKCH